jgi:ketosteroid isomerase-like protein
MIRRNAMSQPSHAVSVAELTRAIEGRDAKALASFYADDALLRIIDHDNPPSKPRELKGKQAIASYYDDVCGRAMSHHIETGVASGQTLAFTQACTYPDGAKVFCAAMLEISGGKIVRQTAVQAWDA